MKRAAGMVAVLLCVAALLAGCGPGQGQVDPPPSGAAGSSGSPSAAVEETGDAFPTAADYYRHLRDNVLVGSSDTSYKVSAELASTQPLELRIEQGDFMETFAWDHRMTGTISAVVEDFDHDGTLEMLTILADSVSVQDTTLSEVLYPSKEYNSDVRIFELRTAIYDVKDGEIVRDGDGTDPVYLPMGGWGYVVVGMEKLEEDYCLYAWVYSENMSTYGPSYYVIKKLPTGRGYYRSAISAYGLPEVVSYYTEGLGNYSDTTIYDRIQTIQKTAKATSNLDPEEEMFEAALDGGLICFFNVAYPEWGGSKAVQTITDYTNLRHYLENDAADWTPLAVPQGGARELPEGGAGLDGFISELEAAAGVEFASGGAVEEDGIYKETFTTAENTLVVRWDTAQDEPQMVGLYSNGEEPAEEWFTLKDAVLSSSIFGWTPGDTDALKGRVKWDTFSAGVDIGGYNCSISLVMSANLNITRK